LSIDFYRNDSYTNNKEYYEWHSSTIKNPEKKGLYMPRKSSIVSEIIDNIRRAFQVVNEQSKKAKRETGLTGPQLWAIKTIADLSPVRVSDLARRMYLHPATVVGILNRLESQGLIKRLRTNDDRRVVNVELTDVGNALVAKAPQVAQGLLVAGLEKLPLEKLQEIAAGLQALVHILGAQELPPQLLLSQEVNLPKRHKTT
jgi:MarR family transcriptional regulator, organic hydroperoxide resistance regulator